MRQLPLRFIAITVSVVVLAAVVAVSVEGSTAAGAVTVRPGDTLWALSRRYNVGLDQLASANKLRVQDVLPIGRTLEIPGQPGLGSATMSVSAKGGTATPAAAAAGSKTSSGKPASGKPASGKGASGKPATPTSPSVPPSAPPAPVFTAAELLQMRNFCVSYNRPAASSTPLPSALVAHPERLALRPLFVKWSATYGVSASLVEAIAWQESGWQNDVTSSANAQGIGQLLPTTAAFVSGTLLGVNLKSTVASDNIQMMVRFLSYLLAATGGDQCAAVASYYEGFGAFRSIGVIPDAQAYVRSVFNLRSHFS